jgi:hypothetical protein
MSSYLGIFFFSGWRGGGLIGVVAATAGTAATLLLSLLVVPTWTVKIGIANVH